MTHLLIRLDGPLDHFGGRAFLRNQVLNQIRTNLWVCIGLLSAWHLVLSLLKFHKVRVKVGKVVSQLSGFDLSDDGRHGGIQICQWFKRDMAHLAIMIGVVNLIPVKGSRVFNFDQCIASPARAICVDVLHARLNIAPVSGLGNSLVGRGPGLVEQRLVNGASVFETLQIQLTHLGAPGFLNLTTSGQTKFDSISQIFNFDRARLKHLLDSTKELGRFRSHTLRQTLPSVNPFFFE